MVSEERLLIAVETTDEIRSPGDEETDNSFNSPFKYLTYSIQSSPIPAALKLAN